MLSTGPERVRPGTRLVRAWQGKTHHVTVLANGFEWDGSHHRSLSEIARRITGTRWSGPVFFGVKRRAGASALPRQEAERAHA